MADPAEKPFDPAVAHKSVKHLAPIANVFYGSFMLADGVNNLFTVYLKFCDHKKEKEREKEVEDEKGKERDYLCKDIRYYKIKKFTIKLSLWLYSIYAFYEFAFGFKVLLTVLFTIRHERRKKKEKKEKQKHKTA